ncbi:MAG: hypothetical protein KGI54_15420 [Pseudomonadota bacterium]|nr:hypothetical protein [Pseudomonadota bacterium]
MTILSTLFNVTTISYAGTFVAGGLVKYFWDKFAQVKVVDPVASTMMELLDKVKADLESAKTPVTAADVAAPPAPAAEVKAPTDTAPATTDTTAAK